MIRFLTASELRCREEIKLSQAVRASAQENGWQADRYVHATVASSKQIKGVPIVNPAEMLAPSGGRRNWAFSVSVHRTKPAWTEAERQWIAEHEG